MKDSSPRSTIISRPRRAAIIAMLAIGAGVVTYPMGVIHHNNIVAQSSSPIGSTMNFQRSSVKVTLKGLYTDTNKSAMVARIGMAEGADGTKLPAYGTDYKVYVASPSIPNGVKEMDVLFGRLSTDGDMFLVIPKPTDAVYTIFIMNAKYLANANDVSKQADAIKESSPVSLDATEASITKTLSEYEAASDAETGKGVTVKDDHSDIINFRMTLDPAFKSDEYKVSVIDTQLLSDSGQFNFEGLFQKLFKESAYQELSQQHEKLLQLESQLQNSKSEYEQRTSVNPSDADAQAGLKETKRTLEKLDKDKAEVAEQMNNYEQLAYTDSTFANVQTKAKVVSLDD